MSLDNVRKGHRTDPKEGQNRVFKSPNGMSPKFLWQQYRLSELVEVTPTIPRGNRPVVGFFYPIIANLDGGLLVRSTDPRIANVDGAVLARQTDPRVSNVELSVLVAV